VTLLDKQIQKLEVGGSRLEEERTPPPRVFCKKRLDLLDSKGVDFFGDDKEAARDCRERR
jgi:hypothetical protein